MAKKYIWSGNKCRDFWSTTHYSRYRLQGDLRGFEGKWTTLSYRRTAIQGLSRTQAALMAENNRWYSPSDYHLRERPDGLVDLFHIKRIRKSIRTEILEMRR